MAYEDSRVAPNKDACRENKIDIAYRDYCSHKLIPLNKCRIQNFFLPWKCVHERHDYEKCQYEEFQYRVKKAKESS
eukprot:CAMPEP_0184313674 /NCGR_PEP_ID=MMETSP1049-20130417/66229_1 /TAXON_ID=77928 /ORGANISM="Proteomonas sulcata, Strain CCMP704" /LENGTH=75 /DNA_ID=CAMNT_0026631101 /DNA_START=33 /DNA_END=260 /DNA_ORIENTATION=+